MQNKNPYQIFSEWIQQPDGVPLDDDVLKVVSQRAILATLGDLGSLTVLLNDEYNNFEFMSLDTSSFFYFVKFLTKKFKIPKYKFTYFKSEKIDKELRTLHAMFPYLKSYEVTKLFKMIEKDPDRNAFLEALGLNKYKSTKTTKKDKKIVDEIDTLSDTTIQVEEEELSTNQEENDYFKEQIIITFSDWAKNFNKTEMRLNELSFQGKD